MFGAVWGDGRWARISVAELARYTDLKELTQLGAFTSLGFGRALLTPGSRALKKELLPICHAIAAEPFGGEVTQALRQCMTHCRGAAMGAFPVHMIAYRKREEHEGWIPCAAWSGMKATMSGFAKAQKRARKPQDPPA